MKAAWRGRVRRATMVTGGALVLAGLVWTAVARHQKKKALPQ